MATNLIDNVVTSLRRVKIRNVYGWCRSTTVLHWIMGNGSYKQFVSNRLNKMKTKVDIEWKYVRTEMNPADIGSRECGGNNLPIQWLKGLEWIWDEGQSPGQIDIKASSESEVESKAIRDVLKCKNTALARQTKEYLRALKERHNMIHGEKQRVPTIGEIVIIKGDEENRGK